jgi:hypothetical protein
LSCDGCTIVQVVGVRADDAQCRRPVIALGDVALTAQEWITPRAEVRELGLQTTAGDRSLCLNFEFRAMVTLLAPLNGVTCSSVVTAGGVTRVSLSASPNSAPIAIALPLIGEGCQITARGLMKVSEVRRQNIRLVEADQGGEARCAKSHLGWRLRISKLCRGRCRGSNRALTRR